MSKYYDINKLEQVVNGKIPCTMIVGHRKTYIVFIKAQSAEHIESKLRMLSRIETVRIEDYELQTYGNYYFVCATVTVVEGMYEDIMLNTVKFINERGNV